MYLRLSENNVVLMIDDCHRDGIRYPITALYPQEFISELIEVDDNYSAKVGWKYNPETKEWIEPKPYEYIEELRLYYCPYSPDEAQAIAARERKELQNKQEELTVDTDYRLLELEDAQMM